MRIEITTTRQFFAFGFGWRNDLVFDNKLEYRADIILGFIIINIFWKSK